MAAATRPLVSVQTLPTMNDMDTDSPTTVPLPDVMRASIRPDVVNFVHSGMSKNSLQPYAVSKKAGHQTSTEGVEKTSTAIKLLKEIEAYADAEKAKDSVGIRPEKGKTRNRRYISSKGPLVVHGTEGAKLVKTFRNIPRVEGANVDRLNLLKLDLGGHLGRFVIWTRSAFEKLNSIYGSFDKAAEKKNGYVLPRAKMANADLARIINSDEVQSVVKTIKKEVKRAPLKKNPPKNLKAMAMQSIGR
ncbi:unnamed protein product [Linum tenue]|uniref:Large ribosomal subunit protein uL4 C-terminal domain-containing protein n=1 Tax=Linum tenue TaxID=586396 RepID=A0AAV0ITI1_9ROSI|nr:unnamed protein product [Linum tenue]